MMAPHIATVRRSVAIGEIVPIIMPWSEVCMHMRIAEIPMLVRLDSDRMATPMYVNGRSPYCPAITAGEAGLHERDGQFYADVIAGNDREVAEILAIGEATRDARLNGETLPDLSTVSDVLRGYADCALWASTDDDGEPLDGLYFPADLSADAWRQLASDVVSFVIEVESQRPGTVEFWGAQQFGHDFWLTRNGHGAGYWDRGCGELGDWLSDSAKVWGESYLYVSDDGTVECHG